MARNKNNNDSDNNARIKVVFFEAENVSGDLTGLMNAFASAVKAAPVQVIQQPPLLPQTPLLPNENRNGTTANDRLTALPLTEVADTANEVGTTATRQPRPERKAFKGAILDDIKWDGGGITLEAFMSQKNPQDTTKKYLVIATWFKRYGEHEFVDSNLIYNAYRKLNWGVVKDISQPLRDAAKSDRGYFRSETKGRYAITIIGTDVVDKMGNDKSAS